MPRALPVAATGSCGAGRDVCPTPGPGPGIDSEARAGPGTDGGARRLLRPAAVYCGAVRCGRAGGRAGGRDRGWFAFDCASSVPLDRAICATDPGPGNAALIRIFKAFRLLKMFRPVAPHPSPSESPRRSPSRSLPPIFQCACARARLRRAVCVPCVRACARANVFVRRRRAARDGQVGHVDYKTIYYIISYYTVYFIKNSYNIVLLEFVGKIPAGQIAVGISALAGAHGQAWPSR